MIRNLNKTPWPWFGGKSDAAPIVWDALGDVHHYVEPFAGSLAVLMRRPHEANRSYYSETVNDADGLLVNAWRSMQMSPDAMADAASWPVSEADLHARHLRLLRWREERSLEHLMGDPEWHDPVMAGWWAWGQSCWIGSGWCSGKGAWSVGADGRIKKTKASNGADRKRPHITEDGQGVNRPAAKLPGVKLQRPHIGNNGQEVNTAAVRSPGVSDDDFHPMTMPELRRWFRFLSARLRHVRILNGDWSRACTGGALLSLSVRKSPENACGVFLDPPYADTAGRDASLYSVDSLSVAHDVRKWAIENGNNAKMRIVLAGFDGEHEMPADWKCVEWHRKGFLKGGMGNTSKSGKDQQHRERLWLSPHCLTNDVVESQRSLF